MKFEHDRNIEKRKERVRFSVIDFLIAVAFAGVVCLHLFFLFKAYDAKRHNAEKTGQEIWL